MTIRTAEILMAVILALCSIGLMIKSAELNIGWVPEKGPGSGAWPFWLSTGMLLSCLWTIYRWFTRQTAESRSTELYMTRSTVKVVGTSAGSILFLLAVTQLAGIYVALPLFLFIYLKFIGKHGWALTLSLTAVVPIFIFCLFEWALKIPLPKAFTEEAFYPVYDLMYARSAADTLNAFKAPIVLLPTIALVATVLYWLREWTFGRKVKSPASDSDA